MRKKTFCRKYLEWIPLYVTDTLEEDKKKKLEKAFKKCPELLRELIEWQKIREIYKYFKKEVPEVSENIFLRIKSRITPTSKKIFLLKFKKLRFEGFKYFVIIFFQLLIIIILIFQIHQKSTFTTLSLPKIFSNDKVFFNVKFKENAKEIEIRQLLLQSKSHIVEGPYFSGIYVISVNKKQASQSFKLFKQSSIVNFIEKVPEE